MRGVESGDFLKLLITQLQNQDPLNPTDNSDMLNQISQIRNIEATSELSSTLQSVLLGQNLASASSLVDKQISGLSDDGKMVSGRVERVTIADGVPRLVVGAATLSLKNVSEIQGN
jgi:flagellar basal-body rod modification protein FlgD